MGVEYPIMSPYSTSIQPLNFWTVLAGLLWALLTPSFLLGQVQGSGIHAGWQSGPVALKTERTSSLGAHDLGNAGYGHAFTIQSNLNGPWEIEMRAERAQIVVDDGALNGISTEIQSGSVMVNWVWQAAGNRRDVHTRNATISQGFQPFIGLGVSHVDHIMTRDLEDALGRRYHLWSDGTLRDIDEAGDHGGQALILKRDFDYESEIAPESGGGGRSLAIPAQVGVRLDVSPRVRARMGIGGWLGLSDNVDGIESGRSLSGDALASGFFGLGIRLGKLGKRTAKVPAPAGMTSEDAALLAAMDTDGDGVSNLYDQCPGTRGMTVDAFGCPLDSDGDGYANDRDDEPYSETLDVDSRGVTRSRANDEDHAGQSGRPHSEWDVITGKVTSDDRGNYALRVSKPERGWTAAEQHAILAFEKVKQSEGDVLVQVGQDPLEAGRAAHQIRSVGLEADLIAPSENVDPIPNADDPNVESSRMHYRVQLGAYRTPDPGALAHLFQGMEVVRFTGDDGLTRVVSQDFDTRKGAAEFKVRMVSLGFSGAFITSHAPINIPTVTVASSAQQERETREETSQFDASRISFRVQVGALRTRMSVEAMDGLLKLGAIEHRSSTGWHRYLHGPFETLDAARAALSTIQEQGFPDAFVVGDVAGNVVPVSEALILLNAH